MGLAQHSDVLARASPDLKCCEDSARISTQLFVAGSVLVAIVISPWHDPITARRPSPAV